MSTTLLEVTDRAVQFRIARPEKRNALSPEVSRAMRDALREHRSTPRPFIISSSTPGIFVSGTDVGALRERTLDDSLARRNSEVFQQLEEHPWPTVAVVDGPALGGGCELALACDLRLASTRSLWGLPEVRLGIIPSAGGLWRLPQLIGRSAATDLILTGRRIDGTEAHRLGLASRLVAPDELDDALAILLDELNAAVPLAQRLAKEAMQVGPDRRRLVDALAQATCLDTEDTQNRLFAFLER